MYGPVILTREVCRTPYRAKAVAALNFYAEGADLIYRIVEEDDELVVRGYSPDALREASRG